MYLREFSLLNLAAIRQLMRTEQATACVLLAAGCTKCARVRVENTVVIFFC